MGHGDSDDDEPLDDGDDDDRDDGPRRPIRSQRRAAGPARPALDAPERARPALAPAPAPARRGTRPGRGPRPLVAGAAGAIADRRRCSARSARSTGPRDTPAPARRPDRRAPTTHRRRARRSRLRPSVVAVIAHDASGTRRGSGVCVRHGGRDPHQRPARRQRHDRSTSRPPTATCTPRTVVGRDRDHRPRAAPVAPTRRTASRDARAARARATAPTTGDTVWVVGAPSRRRHGAVDEQRSRRRRPTRSCRSTADRPRAVCSRPTPRRAAASSGGALVDRRARSPASCSRRVNGAPHDLRGADRRRASTVAARARRDTGTPRTARSASAAIDAADGPTVTSMVDRRTRASRGRARRRRRRVGRRPRRRLDRAT